MIGRGETSCSLPLAKPVLCLKNDRIHSLHNISAGKAWLSATMTHKLAQSHSFTPFRSCRLPLSKALFRRTLCTKNIFKLFNSLFMNSSLPNINTLSSPLISIHQLPQIYTETHHTQILINGRLASTKILPLFQISLYKSVSWVSCGSWDSDAKATKPRRPFVICTHYDDL